MSLALIVAVALSTPPDTSPAYFTGLDRAPVAKVAIDGGDGPVILIVVDAMRPDRITPYGSARDTTPNLEALADEGLLLTNFYVNGNWTRPSTATLLTGLPPVLHGVESERDKLADQFVTLAEVLGDGGVTTGAVVGNGNAGSAFGLGRGFDFYADTVKHWQGLPSAGQVVELAIPFVRQHRDQRFFLMLFFVDPHDPYHAPAPYENIFVADDGVRLVRSPHWELGHYSPAEIERMTATYDAALHYTDAVLGRFFTALEELDLFDRSTIIVTADHGEAFGEHGVFLHSHHFYDEIVRVPFIIKAPVMDVRGAYNYHLFETIDLLPTIANYFGVAPARDLPGIDMIAHLAEPETTTPTRFVISEFNNFGIRRRMIRTYREKVIYQEPADEVEFMATVGDPALLPSVTFDRDRAMAFDLVADPLEKKDIYSPELLRNARWRFLYDKIKSHRSAHRDRPPTPIVKHLDAETFNDLKALGYIR